MKRRRTLLYGLVPTLALVSIVGAGFSTWYFTSDKGGAAANNVYVTDMVDDNFTVGFAKGISNGLVVLDQKNSAYQPSGAQCHGIYLTDLVEDGAPSSEDKGADGIAIKVTKTSDVTYSSITLHWEAQWSANDNFGTYLYEANYRGDINLTSATWDESKSTTVTITANTGDDNSTKLGLDYAITDAGAGVVGEPSSADEYQAMKEALSDLSLTLVFSVITTAA